jgi:ABC-type tungstate transport system substrate-binding protein/ABC-type nitrate/sulfonate/bicarbonate transport system ATPase subunit
MAPENYVLEVLRGAVARLWAFDPQTYAVFWLSLKIGFVATLLGTAISLPLAWISSRSRSGLNTLVSLLLQALAAVPTVIVGTIVYLFISRRGPLGALELLYTPTAIIIGDVLLIIPLTTIFLKTAFESLPKGLLETGANLGATPLQLFVLACREKRNALIAGFCFSFGRVISEIGCAMILGGNVRGVSRTLTTAIALEISKGESEEAIALGILLLLLSLGNALLLHVLNQGPPRKSRIETETESQSESASPTISLPAAPVATPDTPILPPLRLSGLAKTYASKPLFAGLNASIELTGGTAILGPSGTGKTTLFRLIAGLSVPDSGKIDTQNRHSVLIFQRPHLFSGTVRDNLGYGLQIRSVPRAQREAAVTPLAQNLGIHHLLDQGTENLSGGESARVSLGRALAIDPPILLLDETLVHLDAVSLATIVQVLRAYIQRGGGLLLITHQHHIAAALCRRRLLLQNGTLQEISA